MFGDVAVRDPVAGVDDLEEDVDDLSGGDEDVSFQTRLGSSIPSRDRTRNRPAPWKWSGEIAALEDRRQNASVVARSPMCLIVMTARDMRQLAKTIPEFGEKLRTTAEQRHPLAQA